ncbi:hypothetical protein VTH82DRAFT_3933 [Thermothelomyces myriococcoides]
MYVPYALYMHLISESLELGALPSLDADLSTELLVDYLSKTIVAVITEDFSRIGRDYYFVNPHAPTFNQFFEMMSAASAREEIEPFCQWKERALA